MSKLFPSEKGACSGRDLNCRPRFKRVVCAPTMLCAGLCASRRQHYSHFKLYEWQSSFVLFLIHTHLLQQLVQAWPVDFHQLHVGIRHGCSEVQQPFRNMKGKTGWPRINITRGDDKHVICFIIVVALLVCDQLYAHPKKLRHVMIPLKRHITTEQCQHAV